MTNILIKHKLGPKIFQLLLLVEEMKGSSFVNFCVALKIFPVSKGNDGKARTAFLHPLAMLHLLVNLSLYGFYAYHTTKVILK